MSAKKNQKIISQNSYDSNKVGSFDNSKERLQLLPIEESEDNIEEDLYLLPVGEYEVELMSTYEHVSNNGYEILYFNWQIISGEYSGIIFATSFFKNSSNAMLLYKNALSAMGYKKPKNSDHSHMYGSRCIVSVTHAKHGYYNGKYYRSLD